MSCSEPTHVVLRQTIELTVPSEAAGRDVGGRISRLQESALAAIVERACAAMAQPARFDQIGRVEVDLGQIPMERFEEETAERLQELLPRAIAGALESATAHDRGRDADRTPFTHDLSSSAATDRTGHDERVGDAGSDTPSRQTAHVPDDHNESVADAPARPVEAAQFGSDGFGAERALEILSHFARTATLPWWADSRDLDVVSDSIRVAAAEAPTRLADVLHHASLGGPGLIRLVRACDVTALTELVAALGPSAAAAASFAELTAELGPFAGTGVSAPTAARSMISALMIQELVEQGDRDLDEMVRVVLTQLAHLDGTPLDVPTEAAQPSAGPNTSRSAIREAIDRVGQYERGSDAWQSTLGRDTTDSGSVGPRETAGGHQKHDSAATLHGDDHTEQPAARGGATGQEAPPTRTTDADAGENGAADREAVRTRPTDTGTTGQRARIEPPSRDDRRAGTADGRHTETSQPGDLPADPPPEQLAGTDGGPERTSPAGTDRPPATAPTPAGDRSVTSTRRPTGAHPGVDTAFGDADRVEVHSSGLVLLAPFLPRLLARRELVDRSEFVSRASRHRAAGLFHHVATGSREPREFQVPLEKVLCGIAIDADWDPGEPITQTEAEESEDLITAAIAHAEIFGHVGPDGFRASFLTRRGMLSSDAGTWLLRVESAAHDILLDRLPWGHEWIALPWMQFPLRVEW